MKVPQPGALVLAVTVLALPVAASLFRVWVHHDRVAMSYVLSEEDQKRREARRLAQQLEVELASLRSPEVLSARAAALGLVPPVPEQILAGRSPALASGGIHDRD
jgi:hypothetical protein